jgi:3-oxoacyl-[acyl-carrier-protein] synthase II
MWLVDRVEAVAMERVFRNRIASIVVSSAKSLTGHACGAAGAIGAAFCALVVAPRRRSAFT